MGEESPKSKRDAVGTGETQAKETGKMRWKGIKGNLVNNGTKIMKEGIRNAL